MHQALSTEEMTMFHLKRRVRAVVANVVDTMSAMVTSDLPGIDVLDHALAYVLGRIAGLRARRVTDQLVDGSALVLASMPPIIAYRSVSMLNPLAHRHRGPGPPRPGPGAAPTPGVDGSFRGLSASRGIAHPIVSPAMTPKIRLTVDG
jgi:hypothetical protein